MRTRYKASAWDLLENNWYHAKKNGFIDDIIAGIGTFGLIFLVIIGCALFC